jgi:deazaflavin-dependent oxidoreductase (nitroreductase family)
LVEEWLVFFLAKYPHADPDLTTCSEIDLVLVRVNITATSYNGIYKDVNMSDVNDWNQKIIEEFRANGGVVGGNFEGRTLLLLHTIGAKSGKERVNSVAYTRDEDNYVVIASKGGSPTNPDWYYNILAHPRLTVEVGTETFDVEAEVTEEPERTHLYNKMAEVFPVLMTTDARRSV